MAAGRRADPVATAGPRTRPVTRTDPRAHPVTRMDLRATPVTRATSVTRDPMAQADPRAITRATSVTRTAPALVGPADPARGAAMRSAATSTGPRGATERRPGDGVRHLARHGTGHFRRPAGRGIMAQLTTGAITKRPC